MIHLIELSHHKVDEDHGISSKDPEQLILNGAFSGMVLSTKVKNEL